ncbi:MAG: energy transducer TonB [Rubrivivax sp.]|nr:energy transducer TonB [Pyrinomonadaceae bacterium]
MRTPTRVTLAIISLVICVCAARAQEAAAPWVSVSPKGEDFVAVMPTHFAPYDAQVRADGVVASGRRYEAAGDDANTYIVWSLRVATNAGERLGPDNYASEGVPSGQVYLDLIANLAWDLLVRSEMEDAVRRKETALPSLSMGKSFELGGRAAREYTLSLKGRGGPVYVFADGPRVYIVAAFGPGATAAPLRQFVASFKFKADALTRPAPNPAGDGGQGKGLERGSGAGGGDLRPSADSPPTPDYSKPFKSSEVTQKARITYKPEPAFTDAARRYSVTGVARIHAVLSRTGEVTDIRVVKWLPHGLTRQALDSVRRIKFNPAQKDGHAVSQYAIFEYNFNIY